MTMLYERWRTIAAERGNDLALHETATGRRWTFSRLAAAAEHGPIFHERLIFPQGMNAEFVVAILRAWRSKKTIYPLETGDPWPEIFTPPDHCVHFKTTSASGGTVKLVALTAEQLAADAQNIMDTMGLRADWPNLGVISLAHSYGFSNLVLPLLLHGIPLILAPAPLPEIVRQATAEYPSITLAAVPAMWRAWHESGAIPPNVRLAISAGSPLPLNLEQMVFTRYGLKIRNFLGSSECGGIAYDTDDLPRREAACIGPPLRNVNLSVNADGCLRVHSRAVAETYWPQPSVTLGGGVFQTSDLAELREGKVFLHGRQSDQINVAGRKISPEVIEDLLLAHPRVRECLVFGAPSRDLERSDTIIALVAAESTEAELRTFLLERLPAWQLPREWRFFDSLPTSPRGKISRAEWRRRYAG